MADPALLRIVFDNLLGNARKYAGPTSQIEVVLEAREAVCRISVHDSGTAIPAQDRPALFGKYVRGRNAGAHPGMGLGLFVVERIAQMHGGRVGLDCPPEGGNSFWIDHLRLFYGVLKCGANPTSDPFDALNPLFPISRIN